MTRNEAVLVAKTKFDALNEALWASWTHGIEEPDSSAFDYDHGWIRVGEFNIGSHEYAPGPTYEFD